MEVLHLVKLICKMMGLKSSKRRFMKIINLLISFVFLLAVALLLLPISTFLIVNISNITAVTDASHVTVASILCFGQYLFFVFQQTKLQEIFDDLQNIVNKSICGLKIKLLTEW